jgi:hypothetical protein
MRILLTRRIIPRCTMLSFSVGIINLTSLILAHLHLFSLHLQAAAPSFTNMNNNPVCTFNYHHHE